MVRFLRQVAECLTKLPENVSLEHFPFLYWDFSFIAFLVSPDPWWQPEQIRVLHTKYWTGEEWISFKDYFCFVNLIKYNISAFLEHYELVPFLWHPSCRIAGLLRFP